MKTHTLSGAAGKSGNPLQSLLWQNTGSLRGFLPETTRAVSPRVEQTLAATLAALTRSLGAGTAYDNLGKMTDMHMMELAAAGWWGLSLPEEYGGSGATCLQVMNAITRVAQHGFPTEAGLEGIHSHLGIPHKLLMAGTAEQKARLLPDLASGKCLSALLLTEEGCGGSNPKGAQTTARREGDHYVINGKKRFCGMGKPSDLIGRTVALFAQVEGEEDSYAVFAVEVTPETQGYFALTHGANGKPGFHAIRQAFNGRYLFKNLRVPAANRIEGNGLKQIFCGLNPARVAICANSAGNQRLFLKLVLDWVKQRSTFGEILANRDLIKGRIARMASMIVACEAVRNFCAARLDEGEVAAEACIIPKLLGSESVWESAHLCMQTHGARSFLEGHIIGDNLADLNAGKVYDGENDILAMKHFGEMSATHFRELLEPLGTVQKGMRHEATRDRLFAFAKLVSSAANYALWNVGAKSRSFDKESRALMAQIDPLLQGHLNFALAQSARNARQISGLMLKYGKRLPDMQTMMMRIGRRLMETAIIPMAALHGHASGNEVTRRAAEIACRDLQLKLSGRQPDMAYDRARAELADMVLAGDFLELEGTASSPLFLTTED